MRRYEFGILIGVLLVLGFVRCSPSKSSGTTSGSQQIVCSIDTFVPNYAREVERLLRWEVFPARIAFVRDENYSPEWQTLALQGFDQWIEVFAPHIRYEVVEQPERAHITVRFDPTTANGKVDYQYYPSSGVMVKAEMTIGTKGNFPVDIRSVSAHEFGHALGIGGHSPDPADMMYPTYVHNVPLRLTSRDANTLKTGYCHLFTDQSPSRVHRGEEPIWGTIECRCAGD